MMTLKMDYYKIFQCIFVNMWLGINMCTSDQWENPRSMRGRRISKIETTKKETKAKQTHFVLITQTTLNKFSTFSYFYKIMLKPIKKCLWQNGVDTDLKAIY